MFEDAGEDDFMDVEMSLDVKCTSDDTMDVTSNDLQLDNRYPDIRPVGEWGGSQSSKSIQCCTVCAWALYLHFC